MTELDGNPVDPASLERLALVGYGHFTSMRVDDGRVRGLALHLRRLVRDCRTVFTAELDPELVRERVRRAVRGRAGSFVVRVTVFDPGLDLARPADNGRPGILVTTRGVGSAPPPPLRVRPVRYERDLPLVKHVGLFGALHARRRAQLAGADDALFHDAAGLVSEGPTWNVGFILDGQVVWPDAAVLPGVTMALLRDSGHDHVTAPVTVEQALAAEAAFAANTAVGARAISGIADTGLATDHPLLRELQRSYLSIEGDVL
ncbi:aminotransferase class IV [Streptomyces nogalater]|uniref:Aminotransferase class IV n=1 Tax=Streptomyces nogalater TaxID=38314 RepID=A0ABW0WA75_STRNO